ncbi:MAG: hypothetical protein K5707_07495 [Clostridia bacterium]|nr:hypothetical protein [Clostridia bacterium]
MEPKKQSLFRKLWKSDKTEAELRYDMQSRVKGQVFNPFAMDRVFSRMLIVGVAALVLTLIASLGFFIYKDRSNNRELAEKREVHLAEIDQLYQKGRYGEIGSYIRRNGIKLDPQDAELYKYVQAELLDYEYKYCLIWRLAFEQLPDEEKKTDERKTLNYALQYAAALYRGRLGDFGEPVPENQAYYEELREKVGNYLFGTLGMEEADLAEIAAADELTNEMIEALEKKVREKNGW